jgi:hypothetical protein
MVNRSIFIKIYIKTNGKGKWHRIHLKEHKKVKLFNKVTDMNQEAVDTIAAQNLLPFPGGFSGSIQQDRFTQNH